MDVDTTSFAERNPGRERSDTHMTMTMANVAHQRVVVTNSSFRKASLMGGVRPVRGRKNVVVRSEYSSPSQQPPRLPRSPREQVTQAAEAIKRVAASGKQLFEVEFSLPLIGATDLDDWPGGIRQQCAYSPSFNTYIFISSRLTFQDENENVPYLVFDQIK